MKLEAFKYNNVVFKSRIFANLAEHVDRLLPENVLPNWLELFAADFFEEDDVCEKRLFRMVGFGCKTMMTTRHFVDPFGEAWPQETFIVLEDAAEQSFRPGCRCPAIIFKFFNPEQN